MDEGEQSTAMADMERDARVMELAQQQQEALQNLENIVANQQHLHNTLSTQNQQNSQQQPQEEEVVVDIPNLPIPNNDNDLRPSERRQGTIRRRNGLFKLYSMCNIQLYLIISTFFAFLAIYPSHVSFESIRISVNPYSEIYVNQAVNNVKSQHTATAAALDSQGNVINIHKSSTKKGMFGWEAIVEYNSKKSKHTHPSSPLPQNNVNTWWEKFTLDMSSHLAEHYSILQQIISYPSTLNKATQIKEVATNNNEAKESSSVKTWWLPPWEWKYKHKQNNNNDTLVDETTDKQHLEKNTTQKNTKKKIKLHPHLSPILRKIDLTSISPFLSNKNDGSETVDTSTSTTEEESKHYTTFMNIIDKVFTSTPRLIAVANLLLAVVYLLQTAVADLFLGPINTSNNADATLLPPQDETSRRRRGGREHFFGFLLFKLLIISSVLEPDGIDFFILLSWYTLLSFMRSLSHLAGMTSNHTGQSGEPPCRGSLRLLILVLVCDIAAMSCFAMAFHSIGFSELLLLTFDCLLMFFGTITHIVKYYALTIEESHRFSVQHLEQRQLELHAQRNNDNTDREDSDDTNISVRDSREDEDSSLDDKLEQINQAVQLDEAKHTNRRRRIEKAIFLLEVFTLFLKMVHFIHLWSIHGTSFTLADG